MDNIIYYYIKYIKYMPWMVARQFAQLMWVGMWSLILQEKVMTMCHTACARMWTLLPHCMCNKEEPVNLVAARLRVKQALLAGCSKKLRTLSRSVNAMMMLVSQL